MNRKERLVNKYLPIKYIHVHVPFSLHYVKKSKSSTQNIEKGNICRASMNFNQPTLHKPTCLHFNKKDIVNVTYCH